MYEHPHFVTGETYHIYNRGVAKQPLFRDESDFLQFLLGLSFYRESKPETSLATAKKLQSVDEQTQGEPDQPLVEILAFCLMPNHFHLLVRQTTNGGISTFMSRVLNSFTRYANTRQQRVGTMFQGTFRAVHITSDEQLLHVSRYIHLNPFVARLVDHTVEYRWSSYSNYLRDQPTRLCHPGFVLELSGGADRYQEFVDDYASYARDFALIKDLVLEKS